MEDEPGETPPVVRAAVAVGVAPLPFLLVYAVLFIAHGTFQPVIPPDITRTKHGELGAGLIALAAFILMTLSIWWFLNGRRRWPFVLVQAATLATSIDFIVDSTKGSPAVPIVMALTSLAAVVLSALPPSWRHMQSRWFSGTGYEREDTDELTTS